MHLGTEFEYTRNVDKKNLPIDPFVPKFDIMKATDLKKEINKSQKINVESPRFIKTLERALTLLFTQADHNQNGELTYQQFYDAFKLLPTYDLQENDIRVLLALADENENGQITWTQFIPVGIEAIKTFLARNKMLQKQQAQQKEINKDTLKYVFEPEIQSIDAILKRKFEHYDTDVETKEHTGKITFTQMSEVLHNTSYLSIKEINLLLRDYVMRWGYDEIEYTNFAQDLFEVRFDLARSRIMDINIKKFSKDFFASSDYPIDENGMMDIYCVQQLLSTSKKLTLTPSEINLILGLAGHYDDGKIEVAHLQSVFAGIVSKMFSIEARRRKAQLVQLGTYRTAQINMPEYENLDLFRVFREFDENDKGFLEPLEYIQCLTNFVALRLNDSEILTIALCADIDGTGRIDYQEFMKFFQRKLSWVKFNNELQQMYDEECAYTGLMSGGGVSPANEMAAAANGI